MAKPQTDMIVPTNIEAEEAVLGSCLLDPYAIEHVASFLKPQDFYRDSNRWIYAAVLSLFEQRIPPDFVTVRDEIDRHGHLEEIGGASFLVELVNVVPTSLHVEYYGRIVEKAATRRRVIQAASDIARLAYDESMDLDVMLDRVEQTALRATQRQVKSGLSPLSEALDAVLNRLEQLQARGQATPGTPTGLVDVDRMLGGLQPGDQIIVAGRPSMGKTGLMLGIAHNAARHGFPVAIFSMEMSAEQLAQRLLSSETGIEQNRIRLARLYGGELGRITTAMGELGMAPIFIDDTPTITASEIRSKARLLHARRPLGLIVVDYLQLMGEAKARVEEVDYISRALKQLARELDVPVLVASQLSRAVETRGGDRRPILSDLRESGGIEQNADVVAFLYRDAYYNPPTKAPLPGSVEEAEIIIRKHRNGPTGTVKAGYIADQARFVNMAAEDGRRVA